MRLIRISLDDWQGIYNAEDGKLLDQGHSIDYDRVLEKMGHTTESKYIGDDDLDEFGNHLPEDLSVIFDYIKRKNL